MHSGNDFPEVPIFKITIHSQFYESISLMMMMTAQVPFIPSGLIIQVNSNYADEMSFIRNEWQPAIF